MALINPTYFVGTINIPGTGDANVAQRLGFFIEDYEDRLLRDILGYPLYKAFKDGNAAPSPDQKWLDLRDGKDYTDLVGRETRWDGLLVKRSGTNYRKSLIANYVYVKWVKDNASQNSMLGVVAPGVENSTLVSPAGRMVAAWNEMVDQIYQLCCFLDSNISTYTEWQTRNNYFQMLKYRKTNTIGI